MTTAICDVINVEGGKPCGKILPLGVQQSNAGYYVGRFCPDHGPYERCSDYFKTSEEARRELISIVRKRYNVKKGV